MAEANRVRARFEGQVTKTPFQSPSRSLLLKPQRVKPIPFRLEVFRPPHAPPTMRTLREPIRGGQQFLGQFTEARVALPLRNRIGHSCLRFPLARPAPPPPRGLVNETEPVGWGDDDAARLAVPRSSMNGRRRPQGRRRGGWSRHPPARRPTGSRCAGEGTHGAERQAAGVERAFYATCPQRIL